MSINENPVVTPEAVEALQRLESLRRNGWNLTDMTADEMAAIEVDFSTIYKGRHLSEREIGSYSNTLIHEATEALKQEHLRRKLERMRAITEQENRIQTITAAANSLERADEQMEAAESIEDRRFIIPRRPVDVLTAERAKAMDDAELTNIVRAEKLQVTTAVSNLNKCEHSVSVLEKHGGARGKRLSKTLRAVADESREDLEAHRANISTAQSELDARTRRAEMDKQARVSLPQTKATVDELLSRVAELEEKLAKNPQ